MTLGLHSQLSRLSLQAARLALFTRRASLSSQAERKQDLVSSWPGPSRHLPMDRKRQEPQPHPGYEAVYRGQFDCGRFFYSKGSQP